MSWLILTRMLVYFSEISAGYMTWMDTVELKLAAIDVLVTQQYEEELGIRTTKGKPHAAASKNQMKQLFSKLRKK